MATAEDEKLQLLALLTEAKSLASRYYALTKRPLGVTGEVAELEVVRLLEVDLAPVRESGYDAIRRLGDREVKLQVKGRCVQGSKNKSSQRLGRIRLDQPWDAVLLVLFDANFGVISIHEAERAAVKTALEKPGSKARNVRGALSVGAFKALGRQVWPMAASLTVSADRVAVAPDQR